MAQVSPLPCLPSPACHVAGIQMITVPNL